MTLWEFALWGLAGAGCVEALEFAAAISRTRNWPWRAPGAPPAFPLLVSVVLRLSVGTVLAMALGGSDQIAGEIGAFVSGVAAPVIIERILSQVSRGQPLNSVDDPTSLTDAGTQELTQSDPAQPGPDATDRSRTFRGGDDDAR
ncbi:hypothetical protein HNR06_004147 [Nocardiopsis arvandica]|uniref:DUF1622 domain-containing protein n=1 Tax=Nocardiopsis sinuspersici TaxID=501010 RepID=A0A7Z0BK80_9ACTN|nr:hypothetical protein [Nocardiopsis sinuspersici]NYH54558.1 hypothetical protein [Nocardiopsis sinuspersici]